MKRLIFWAALFLFVFPATIARGVDTTTYRGITVQSTDPTGAGGLRIQNNQKLLADRMGNVIEAADDPTANDDDSGTGGETAVMTRSLWHNTTTDGYWICTDATTGAATWLEITDTGLILGWLDDVMPTYLWAVEGQECNVYFDNVFYGSPRGAWEWEFDSPDELGIQYDRRWSYTPSIAASAEYTNISIKGMLGDQESSAYTPTLRVTEAGEGNGTTRQLLYVTDSTGVSGASSHSPLHELVNLFAGDVMVISCVGTTTQVGDDADGNSRSVDCEARAGWTWQLYVSNQSPFWSGTYIDYPWYETQNSISLASGDWVIFHLGINDVANITSDAAVATELASMYSRMNYLVGLDDSPAATTIRGAVSGVRIGLCITIPPAWSQDAWGSAGTTDSPGRWRNWRNRVLLQQWIIDTFDNSTFRARGIYVIPLHANIDTQYGFQRTATAVSSRIATQYYRPSDASHPTQQGSEQMADSLFAFLKGMEVSW